MMIKLWNQIYFFKSKFEPIPHYSRLNLKAKQMEIILESEIELTLHYSRLNFLKVIECDSEREHVPEEILWAPDNFMDMQWAIVTLFP